VPADIASVPIFHCFGTDQSQTTVDTETAVEMLRASGCRHLAVNTHSVGAVSDGDDLPVGYGDATFGSVREAFAPGELIPVLNINMPISAAEAIDRTRRAHLLTGIRAIKLEVLDPGQRLAVNAAVVEATRELVGAGLEVWPLITPDPAAALELEAMGCPLLRVMGSEIGSGRGIDPRWGKSIDRTLEEVAVPVMFDGGVGSPLHATEALAMGFHSVLVNSCLFGGDGSPLEELRRFVAAVRVEHEALPV
jgi:thiazole synthase